jgi:hypothetical protein
VICLKVAFFKKEGKSGYPRPSSGSIQEFEERCSGLLAVLWKKSLNCRRK